MRRSVPLTEWDPKMKTPNRVRSDVSPAAIRSWLLPRQRLHSSRYSRSNSAASTGVSCRYQSWENAPSSQSGSLASAGEKYDRICSSVASSPVSSRERTAAAPADVAAS